MEILKQAYEIIDQLGLKPFIAISIGASLILWSLKRPCPKCGWIHKMELIWDDFGNPSFYYCHHCKHAILVPDKG